MALFGRSVELQQGAKHVRVPANRCSVQRGTAIRGRLPHTHFRALGKQTNQSVVAFACSQEHTRLAQGIDGVRVCTQLA